ncbi:MAG: transcriptional regulator PpsR, partial [Pseudomonadota bacterium]
QARAMELNHSDRGDWEFPVRYTLHQIGPDGALLMLGRDLRPIAEMQEQLVSAQMALERDYEAQREYDTRFRVLLDTVPDAILFVALDRGRITEVNGTAASLIGTAEADLSDAIFDQEFGWKRKGGLLDALATSAVSNMSKPIEATATRTRKRVLITPRLFRAAGERFLLCALSGGDATPVADELTDALTGFFRSSTEGLVFTDLSGTITAANEAFLTMADIAQTTLATGRPLADFLSRGSVDAKVLTENAVRSGRMSLYATKLVSEFGSERSVEISVTYLNDITAPALVFVMRDTSRAETVRSSGINSADDGVKSVMELVGSASLKEIVADTTDVVEKMCIETAVRLTNNNRVAAAEMLGLSRQSLYVKLRKYDLLSRDPD